MNGGTTVIKDPTKPGDKGRKFEFDYSYWSHDGYNSRPDGYLEPKSGSNYADQVGEKTVPEVRIFCVHPQFLST